MRVSAGGTFISYLRFATEGLTGYYGFRLLEVGTDNILIARTTTGVEEIGDGIYKYTGTAPADIGTYYGIWDADETEDFQDDELLEVISGDIEIEGQPTFATRADIETALGRDLTTAESGQVDLYLVLATGAIAAACDRDMTWAETLDPVPMMLKIICMEAVKRVLQNPQGLKSGSESLGAYSRSGTYADGGGAFALSDYEARLVRRAVYGRLTGSAPLGSIFQEAETT